MNLHDSVKRHAGVAPEMKSKELYISVAPQKGLIEFSLNVFTEFAEFSDKNICHYSKRAQT